MKSLYGIRGSVCAHFGWTWDYLIHGIAWCTVERMIADAPGIEHDANEYVELDLSDENADRIKEMIEKENL
ncbi:MAG: hypothetical protein LBP50_09540 [Tannerella sp.]|jgi:hypothetical protein|nr:hypothetical protein [Tannerella sp.]